MPSITVSRISVPSPKVVRRPADVAENVFSVDVEDWYHLLDQAGGRRLPRRAVLPTRVERNFLRLMDLFEAADMRVTCFFLGCIAERFPQLVREAARRGHEIASHGYDHRPVSGMTPSEFLEDAVRSRQLLEDVAGCTVRGYRAAGLSAIERTPWFFDKLLEASYQYDSSVIPSARQLGGIRKAMREPHRIVCGEGILTEFPVTIVNLYRRPLGMFGNGQLRVLPLWLTLKMAKKVNAEGRMVVYSIHPHDIDQSQPRLPMPIHRRFERYVNLRGTEAKIARIARQSTFVTFSEFLDRHRDTLVAHAVPHSRAEVPAMAAPSPSTPVSA